VHLGVDLEFGPVFIFVHQDQHGHGLCGCGGFVEQTAVANLHLGQRGYHVLEVEQRLQPALRNFCLVGGLRRVPERVLQHVAHDGVRDVAVVESLSDLTLEGLVQGSLLVGQFQSLHLSQGFQVEVRDLFHILRDYRRYQFI